MFFIIISFFIIFACFYINTPKFGHLPTGEYLEKIQKSQYYKNGKFRNVDYSHVSRCSFHFGNAFNLLKLLWKVFLNQKNIEYIPSVKTDLMHLAKNENVLIWFGHSSYFIQIETLKILVDPVFSEISSPIPFFPRAFAGSNAYVASDIPEIDYLIITHDHWDHLDYETVKKLKFKEVICPLGVGAHFRYWGLNNITEMNWDEVLKLKHNCKMYCFPSKHFSGRGFRRNKTLWASFLLETSKFFRIFIGGDGGYGSSFSEIGKKFEGIDVAVLENGQYNPNWQSIHMNPYETMMAAKELKAKALLPVHNTKFALSTHHWKEPLEKITAFSSDKGLKILTPMIGQKVKLTNPQVFAKWWRTCN
jgi:L-ascorbate metabolism protein UlaG (beta-lactamase superfamily)